MKIRIRSLEGAILHEPQCPTYAIRIYNSEKMFGKEEAERARKPLRPSLNYNTIIGYEFDDIDPGNIRGVLFDEKIAKKIIEDFELNKKSCEELLVYCMLGRNRSPAVAIALNEIFSLGENPDLLKLIYRFYTRHVYQTMIEATKRNG